MDFDHELTEEEAELARRRTRSSWSSPDDPYRSLALDQLVDAYVPNALSMPANHRALRGHDEIRAWYARRTGDYEMNVVSEVDAVDIVGDLAILSGIFRVTRRPEEGVAGLDHGGRFLSVLRRVDGRWRMWRDMDTPSPDADVLYHRLPRGM
jgi:ketosteroid isomerase-like protein